MKIDLHVHCSERSGCGRLPLTDEELPAFLRAATITCGGVGG